MSGAPVRDRQSVLMITYVFPPAAWVGGHRTMKYCKFIGVHGWQPVVLTAKPTGVTFQDPKLLRQIPPDITVHRTFDFDPAKLEAWLARHKKPQVASQPAASGAGPDASAPRLSLLARLRRAIKALAKDSPDSHLFWAPFAIMRGLWILLTRRIDVIYCSTPPHSSHLIAYALAKLSGKPYVLDFRDPWCVLGSVSPPEGRLPWLLRWETATKRRIVRGAARVICVSAGERDELRAENPDLDPALFTYITNGFDSDDMPAGELPAPDPSQPLALIHAGTIYPGIADELFAALRSIVERARGRPPGVVVHLLGEIAFEYLGLVEELRASGVVRLHGLQPHARALQMMRESDVLLILMGGDVYQASHLPSKGFEYLRIGRPILALARDGELTDMIRRSGLGTATPPGDAAALADAILAMRDARQNGTLQRPTDREFIARYERSALAGQLAGVLDGVRGRAPAARRHIDLRASVIRNVIYPLWVRRNHSARLRYLRALEDSQYWPRARLEQHQLERLRHVVRHAWESSPYYRSRMDAARVAPDDVRALADIARLPLLTKEEIQLNRDAMISTAYRGQPLIEDMTGGSTGAPMRFFYDNDRRDWREGATLRHDQWSGWQLGESRAILWGASQDMRVPPNRMARLREGWIERRLILDASALDDGAMEGFAQRLRAERPVLLLAYANTLGLFARYVQQAGIRDIAPRAIITSAEVLTDETRALAESVFGCPVFNRYGCREFAVIASQCEAHGPLHVNAENLLLETLVEGVPRAGEPGEIVITDLRNLAMPMIRYAIRDTGTLVGGSCSCGRHLPRLEMAAGRVTDFLVATTERKVSGIVIATYVSTHIPGIAQMQIEQHERGRVAVRVVRGKAWSDAAREQLVTRLREYLGSAMQVDVVYVDSIPHERSGKFRFSISHL